MCPVRRTGSRTNCVMWPLARLPCARQGALRAEQIVVERNAGSGNGVGRLTATVFKSTLEALVELG
jgi:hypothetical protein